MLVLVVITFVQEYLRSVELLVDLIIIVPQFVGAFGWPGQHVERRPYGALKL